MPDTNCKILYVEDDPTNRVVFTICLEDYFPMIDTAVDGLDALALIKRNNYDLIVTDISMPKMNGEELQLIVKDLFPDLPVIAHTGNANYSESANRFLTKGFAGYIAKPFEIKNTVDLINNVLKKQRAI